MGPTGLPAEIFAGPYGFIVVIVICGFWGLREWRKGREQDVQTYKKRAEDAQTQAEAAERKSEQESGILESRIENLTTDIRQIRTENFRDQEMLQAKYYAARQMLISMGVQPENIP